jgi:hypothetical protein
MLDTRPTLDNGMSNVTLVSGPSETKVPSTV